MTLFPLPDNFVSGYYSNRNPLKPPVDRGIDAAISGSTNMMHTDILTWRRKPGMSRWSTAAVTSGHGIVDLFSHIYNSNVRVIADEIDAVSEWTPTTRTQFYSKSGTNGDPHAFAFASVKDVLYMSGSEGQRKRIGGAATTKLWGIPTPTVAPTRDIKRDDTGARVRIGWKWAYCWKDSSTGHISSRSPISLSTGNNRDAIWNVRVQGNADTTTIDKISIFRTQDGGSTLFFLKDVDNSGAGEIIVEDQAPDKDLNQQLVCPSEDDNDPPPNPMPDITFHGDRLWGISGDTVRFSLHPIDGTVVNGVAEECWPPLYTFRFNAPVKLMSSSSGLLVFTQECIHIITGKRRDEFDPDVLYYGIGISNRHAVAKDGDTFYLFTNTKEIIKIGEQVEVISHELSDADLATFNPATVRLTVFRKGTRTSLYVSNGANKTFRYCLNTGTWSPVWTVDGGVVSTDVVAAVQTAIGTWNLLYGPVHGNAGYIWKEDETTHLNDTVTYTCNLRLGSFILSPLGAPLAGLTSILTQANILPSVTILPQEISGSTAAGSTIVSDPPLLVSPSTLSSARHYPQTTNQILACSNFQMDIAWGPNNDAAELYGLAIEYNETV